MTSNADNPSVILHLSSTAVHIVVASKSACGQKVRLVVASSVATDSFCGGKILHRDKLVNAIKKAVQQAEETSGLRVASVVVCVAVTDFKSDNVTGETELEPDQSIGSGHMTQALTNAKAKFIQRDDYLAQFSGQMVWLDDDPIPIKDALGMRGVTKLVSSYHLMTLPADTLNAIYGVVQEVAEVHSVIFDMVAGAMYGLMDDERRRGVLFVDIGAKITNICVYKDDVLLLTGVIAMGGDDITDDIACEFGITHLEAERLKRHKSTLLRRDDHKKNFVPIHKDGHSGVVNYDRLCQVTERGYSRLFYSIMVYMDNKGVPKEFCDAGVVLAGGGSRMTDLVGYLKKTLQMPVHLVNHNDKLELCHERLDDHQLKSLGARLGDQKLQTAFGALLCDLNDEFRREQAIHDHRQTKNGFWQSLLNYKQWLLDWLKRHA